jgi:parallel beta-helix repeat protein
VKNGKRDFKKAFIFAVLFATLACVSIGTASVAEPHYVNSGESIQVAIDNATAGDTIIVRDGTYTENVNVNVDHLTLKSEHGYDSTVVHAASTRDHVFEVTADYVNITGFTVTGATGAASDYIYTCGIYLYRAEHCIISDNNALNNWRGIYLVYSSNNSLMNNTAKENSNVGIFLYSSCNNSLMDNTVKDNNDGIYLSL